MRTDFRNWVKETYGDVYSLADVLGVHPHTIHKWMRGEGEPRRAVRAMLEMLSEGQFDPPYWYRTCKF